MTKYKTIVIDPPWSYKQSLANSAHTRGSARKKYPTMSDEDILSLPVNEWADNDCQLWLWVTNSHLHLGFHCLEKWGFRYITCATWIKTHFGLGYWLRGATEHILLGVKGHPRQKFKGTKHGVSGKNWSTLIVAPRGAHSEKPQAFYDMVEDMGEPPRLEVFARKRRMGWDAIGNEVGVKI